jgi:homoserine O-acetyltransferase/O-succinyltransferase
MSGISESTHYVTLPAPLGLESGGVLDGVTVAYRTWGERDASGSNGVLICHALTGNADADEWWEPLIGSGRALDPSRDFIISSNILGSCYGTTGPVSIDPETSRPYGAAFPPITVRDIVALQRTLVRHLGVRRLRLVIGGSFGGMQVLEWALAAPDVVEAIAPIATSGRHSPWTIAWSEAQRQAIYNDPDWQGGAYDSAAPPARGLAVARMIAMSTYRSHAAYASRFGRTRDDSGAYAVESWLRGHGERLVRRFDANAYVRLTEAMDSHDVARGRGPYEAVLGSIRQPALVVSIDSDVLYPPTEQEELALLMPNATLRTVASPHGHDGFLIDAAALNELVAEFRGQRPVPLAQSA